MSAVTASLGINSLSTGIVEKVTTSLKTEAKVLTDYSGAFATAASIDPIGEFTVSGRGSYPTVALGIVASGSNIPSSITGGKIVVDKYQQNEKSGEFQTWEIGGKHYPSAA